MPDKYNRRIRRGRLRDRFRQKPVEPVKTDKPVYDLTGELVESEPTDQTEPQSRWAKWRKERREYVIKRKKAQAGIAKHRKWVLMWIAVIVVAIVILAIFVMNKMSLTGILF